jgi:hypothetical protein
MNNNREQVALIAMAALLGATAGAQQTANIDFKSVGRAAVWEHHVIANAVGRADRFRCRA